MPIQFPESNDPPIADRYEWGYPGTQHSNMPASSVIADYGAATSGCVVVSVFQARFDHTFDSMCHLLGNRNGATISNFQMGLYQITALTAAPSGTLVARTADDTTAVTGGTYSTPTVALSTTGGYPASYSLRVGQWYATGWLVVGTTTPQMYARNYVPFTGGPLDIGLLNGQTALPTSLSGFSWGVGGLAPYIALMP